MFVTYGNNKQHSTVAQRPGEVQRIRDPTLAADVLIYNFIFFCQFARWLSQISQYSEGPATGHLDTGFSWFPCVYKQMLR